MDKKLQVIPFALTLLITVLSFLIVYDTLSRFGFIFLINNIFSLPVIHAIYVFFMLILCIPTLRFHLLVLRKKSDRINGKENNELIDEIENETLQNGGFKKAWKWYYLFTIVFLLHPLMLILITLDSGITVNNPIGVAMIIMINILLGIYLMINSKRAKTALSLYKSGSNDLDRKENYVK